MRVGRTELRNVSFMMGSCCEEGDLRNVIGRGGKFDVL